MSAADRGTGHYPSRSGQLGLIHGEMSADVQSALRRVRVALDRVSDEELDIRRKRCDDYAPTGAMSKR